MKEQNIKILKIILFLTITLAWLTNVAFGFFYTLLVFGIYYYVGVNYEKWKAMKFEIPPIDYQAVLDTYTEPQTIALSDKPGETYYRRRDHPEFYSTIYPDRPDIQTVPDQVDEAINRFSDLNCVGWREKLPNGKYGKYQWLNYHDVGVILHAFGRGLRKTFPFLEKQSKIGLYGKNCKEIELALFGAFNQSLVIVPLYDSLGTDSVTYILNHAEVSVLVVTNEKLPIILECLPNLKYLKSIIMTDIPTVEIPRDKINVYDYQTIVDEGMNYEIERWKVLPKELAYIMYTSGTTGSPKGAMLTHEGLLSIAVGLLDSAGPIVEGDVYLSFLPLAHGFETAVHLAGLSVGGCVGYYHGQFSELRDDIVALKPSIFCGVPRVYHIIYNQIISELEIRPIICKALRDQAYACRHGYRIKFWDKLVFNKIKKALGGKMRLLCVGAANLSTYLKEFLSICLDCPMIEGYGLTECHAIALVNKNNVLIYNYNNCGFPMCSCEVKLVDVNELNYKISDKPYPRGELCIRGLNIFKGYYKDIELSNKVLDKDGWLHSNDICMMNMNGSFNIIDRLNNVTKLCQGEYVCLEYLESFYESNELVSQCFIYGDCSRRCLIGLIGPNPSILIDYAKIHGFVDKNMKYNKESKESEYLLIELCNNKEFVKLILKELQNYGRENKLKGFEIIYGLKLISELNNLYQCFSVENGLITPTFKLKRKCIYNRYKDVICELYFELGKEGR